MSVWCDHCFTEARQFRFFVEKLQGGSRVSQNTLQLSVTKVENLGTLPDYSAETEKDFMMAMTADGLTKTLTALASEIEETLRIAHETCQGLGMTDADDFEKFLPGQDAAQQLVKSLMEKVSATTCLKILNSKAAQQKAVNLAPNVEATLNFIRSNSVTVPEAIMARMHELRDKLPSGNPAKRAKTA
jgi:hypothetical protein